MKAIIFSFLLFFSQYALSQVLIGEDTVNRYDNNHKKTGVWVEKTKNGFQIGVYKNDLKEGRWESYNKYANPVDFINYVNGREVAGVTRMMRAKFSSDSSPDSVSEKLSESLEIEFEFQQNNSLQRKRWKADSVLCTVFEIGVVSGAPVLLINSMEKNSQKISFKAKKKYLVSFQRSGLIKQELILDFSNNNQFKPALEPEISVTLFDRVKEEYGISFPSILNKPYSRYIYSDVFQRLVRDNKYTSYASFISKNTAKKDSLVRYTEESASKTLGSVKSQLEYNKIKVAKLKEENELNESELLKKEMLAQVKQKEIELLNKDKALQQLYLIQNQQALKQKGMEFIKSNQELELANQNKKLKQEELNRKSSELDYQLKLQEKQNTELSLQKNLKQSIEKEASQQKTIKWIFASLTLLFVGFSWVSFKRFKESQKQKMVIEHQKQLVEEKKEEITDSINYAQRIQQSILPPLSEVSAALPNSFILFKPKDIVSGDFYWFEEIEDKILIAAADCTGHGVPGAFMSTIGSEKLNEAVKDSTDVSVILNLVNRGMKKVLRQSEKADSTRDGMDIALCAFNKEMTKLEYAGANRPLWIVRKSPSPSERGRGEVIEETKATKVAIGGYTEDEQVFAKHEIDLKKGDTIYIFSDGYADQFSPQDKKLMTRKFKEIILSIQNKSMEEQREYLGSFIESWKGNMEQTDDILVIGVKI